MNSREVFLTFDHGLLQRLNNDWSSNITPLFFRPNGYRLFNMQILVGRVMLYVWGSFDRKERREIVNAEWRKSILGIEGSLVGLEDDGKYRRKN